MPGTGDAPLIPQHNRPGTNGARTPLDRSDHHHHDCDMTREWPDPKVPYEYPQQSDTNARRWRDAIALALDTGTLRLIPKGEGNDFYELVGACPRCMHTLGKEIEFNPIIGLEEKVEYNIDCNCPAAHQGRPEGESGCGWGGWIGVQLSRPS